VNDTPVGTHVASTPSTPSRVGGRYVLRGVLGRGGMATVHRARDEVLDRDVAVKLLHAHLASDPAFLDRFRREARAAAALSHPNVVAVHDWGETDEGPFLVLQLIDGPSLREVLRHRRRLHPEEVVSVLGPAAVGLGAAHAAGLVHRDVKPENLLLGLDGTVRVTDFGLARAAASATSTFGTDVLVGSPHYLSPEAVRGEPLDPSADVYALGVVLFELLTGRPPFEADSPFATAVQHTSQRVPAPSSVDPDLPASLDAVVARATSPDRDARYPDATAFSAALTAAVPAGAAPLPGLFAADGDEEHGGRRGTAVLGPEAQDTTVAGSPPPPLVPPPPSAPPSAAGGPPPPPSDGARPSVAWDAAGAQLWPPPEHAAGAEDERDGEGGGPVAWLADLDHGDDEVDLADAAELQERDATEEAAGEAHHRRRWLVPLLVVLGLLGASALGGFLLWDRVLAPVTAIPAVAEAPLDAAVRALEEAGFEVEVDQDRPNSLEVPADHVISQDPTGEGRQGTTVTLVVSAGPRQVDVVDVRGELLEEAEAALAAADLRLGSVTEAHDESVPPGAVISSDPAPREVIDEASEVDLVVSLGPRPREVPDLIGSTLSDAQSALRELGLEAEVAGREHSDRPAGQIIATSPGSGSEVERGSTVRVTLSDGPAPVEVPNVRGQLLAEAVETLEGLGLEVEVERRGGVGAFFNPGRVFEQDPGPGSELLPGETVLVFAYND
jgi:eukaryotic-like serine/threonine-protein kinase